MVANLLSVDYVKLRFISQKEEAEIFEDLLTCFNIYFGLPALEVGKLVYQCDVVIEAKNTPPSWCEYKSPGQDWFKSLMKSNPSLSLRSPEATYPSRPTLFNKTNVQGIFRKLTDVMGEYQFKP